MSSNSSAVELEQLAQQNFGKVEDYLLIFFIGNIFYGLFIVLITLSTYFLCFQGIKSRASVGLLVVTMIMFATSSTYLGLSLANALLNSQINLYAAIQSATDVQLSIYHKLIQMLVLPRLQNAQNFLPVINYVLSDAIVIWRAWVLWEHNIRVLAAPIVLLIGTTGAALASAAFEVKLAADGYHTTAASGNLTSLGNLQYAVWFMTLATNLVATVLISIKAWQHRQVLRATMGAGNGSTMAERMMALLVESGALYCVIWAIFILANFDFFGQIGNDITRAIMVQVTGIYPTVIVVLVALRRTAWDVNYTNDDTIPSKTHVVIKFPSSDGSRSFERSKASIKPNGEV